MVDDHNVFAERDYSSLVQWIAEGKVAAKLTATYPLNQMRRRSPRRFSARP
jgi:hypothetical protein